jgi:hypothetical protein
MSLTRPLQSSDGANTDVDLNSAFSGEESSYGSSNEAGRGAKRRIVFRVDGDGKYVGLGLVSFDPADVYKANAAWVRSAKPVDPAEIVFGTACGAYQRPDGSWASWMEMVQRWEHAQVIDESFFPAIPLAA